MEAVEKRNQVFLQSFNLPKYVVAGLLKVGGLFSLSFYRESGFNQYAEQKTSADVLGRVCYYLSLITIEKFYCRTI